MGEDPKGFGAGDANLYRYVGNDPVSGVDPSGETLVVNGSQRVAVRKFFGENNVEFVKIAEDQYKVVVGDAGYRHLRLYEGDETFKAQLEDAYQLTRGVLLGRLQRERVRMMPPIRVRSTGGLVRVGYELRYVNNTDAFYEQYTRSYGFAVDPELGATIMEQYWLEFYATVFEIAATEAIVPLVAFRLPKLRHLARVGRLGRFGRFGARTRTCVAPGGVPAKYDPKFAARQMGLDPEKFAKLPSLRQQYVTQVASLRYRVSAMRKAGMSSEQIARTLHAERRALGV